MTFGCATLNSRQKSELEQYKAQDGVYVEEKSPGTATALGILPGGGSFYTRQWGLGVVDLLLWPFSILWDPIAGYEGALVINHDETVLRAKQKMKKELEVVEEKLDKKEISEEEYRRERHKIEQKYSVD
ncbi:MAG: hypothetical protein HYR79_03795 [Nitrospirae bacterium]|nr:hypothetical protein [Nitrospirota bacterium]